MQGTVKEFSEETRSGAVLLDDGTEIPVPASAFARSGLLKLQFGQRVRFEVEGEGDQRRVTTITIATL
ncbi:MAG TPA: cold shock domain-containing protein [Frankiaceae bacterium]|jgi:2-phospho-L-lactate guanylyltransferase|nr:cold shock domain-containing protein [Frankiaceae bacterium]